MKHAESLQLAGQIGQTLAQRGLTLAVAESCTGGQLAATIVAISGSSDYFLGGVVAYANEIKMGVLGVRAAALETHGAVSWQVATQMAEGARQLCSADLALSTTGIAGPTGGTPAKPVGTVYLALATAQGLWWERHQWQDTRSENNQASTWAALALLDRYLRHEEDPLEGSTAAESGVVRAIGPSPDQPISVELAGPADPPRPRAFSWAGQRYPVDSQGRTWQDAQGGWHCLVMSGSRGSFELYRDAAGDWYLRRAWLRPAAV